MQITIRYTSEVPASDNPECSEKLPNCDVESGAVRVCFEDGSGVTVCKNCFNQLLDEGMWVTDSTIRLAS